jgi:non-ribosomal peptide synthetase component F
MLEHWKTFLAGIVADPAPRFTEIPLLSDEERRMILVEWNATATSIPGEEHQGSVRVAGRERAGRVAVILGKERLTYAELNRRANRLARSLRDRGIGPGVRRRFLEALLRDGRGHLAILKAGGAYVPLDSSYPKERLAFLISDTGCLSC